jgi:hypothetical protein
MKTNRVRIEIQPCARLGGYGYSVLSLPERRLIAHTEHAATSKAKATMAGCEWASSRGYDIASWEEAK